MEELVKEQPVYEIQKVKVKNNQLTAEYTEKFVDANYKNNIVKESEQFIHSDLRYALDRLKPHAVKICEMHEATLVNVAEPSDDDLNEKLKSIMQNIHEQCVKYGKQADGYTNYVKGANVAGFMKVAKAMMAQGIV